MRFDSSWASSSLQNTYYNQFDGAHLSRNSQPINYQHKDNELVTRILNVESKRFYIDVKENQIGRFIKISQVGLQCVDCFSFLFSLVHLFVSFLETMLVWHRDRLECPNRA